MVHSFAELISTRFEDGINALCWRRELDGNFAEVSEQLAAAADWETGILPLDAEKLRALPLSPAGEAAVECMLADYQLLTEHGLVPSLDCIRAYPREQEADAGAVPTDVYSFHADSAPEEADTWLCTYHGACSEGIPNAEVERKVDLPEIRARLLEEYGGADDDGFLEYLSECCYDLHYAVRPGARPWSFGTGNLWRIAVEYPGSPVPPCVHRAPENLPGQPARLLLIS